MTAMQTGLISTLIDSLKKIYNISDFCHKWIEKEEKTILILWSKKDDRNGEPTKFFIKVTFIYSKDVNNQDLNFDKYRVIISSSDDSKPKNFMMKNDPNLVIENLIVLARKIVFWGSEHDYWKRF